jgi:hypothetical protein
MGGGPAERAYLSKCVENGGNVPVEQRAAAEDGVRVGELVQFPSGGSMMKVTAIQDANAIVQWTTDAGQVVSGTIPAVALAAAGNNLNAVQEQPNDQQLDPPYVYRPCGSSVVLNGKHECL